ncbi:MAG: hypothetical protein AAF654_05425 [Myxococcota bacterium]
MRSLAIALVVGMMGCGGGDDDEGALPRSNCFETDDAGIVSFEAEQLPFGDNWELATAEAGFSGTGYIQWTGNSQNNNPGEGLMSLTLAVDTPGLYQLQWRTGVGRGDNGTEHNDTWLRFPDAAAYFGRRVRQGQETRRYPRPLCEDEVAMSAIVSAEGIEEATCPDGSTREGWLKVYRSGNVRESDGALRWTWHAFTSDNDAHDVHVLFESAGEYTMEVSARGDFHLLDRVVLHPFDLEETDDALSLSRANTACGG